MEISGIHVSNCTRCAYTVPKKYQLCEACPLMATLLYKCLHWETFETLRGHLEWKVLLLLSWMDETWNLSELCIREHL